MKKHNLLKILGIAFLSLVFLSWIIPVGVFEEGSFISSGYSPAGLLDLFEMPILTFPTFISYGILIVVIGGLYGVLNKTGVYPKMVTNIAKKFKGKEKAFIIGMIIFLALLSSLTGLSLLLLVLVPFLAAILLLMGFPKIIALASTVGSILVGAIGSTYGFSGTGYVINMFGLDINDNILAKIVLMIVVVALFILFVVTNDKIKKLEKKESKKIDVPLYEEGGSSKKSSLPLIIISIIFFVILVLGMYNWYYSFKITFFQEMHSKVMDFVVKDYPLFRNIIGNLTQFGYWGTYELVAFLVIFTALIGWIYNVKFNDFIDSFVKGMKEVLAVAFYVIIANVVFAALRNLSDGSILGTIAGHIGSLSKNFNILTTSLIGMISPLFYNDFYYLLDVLQNVFTSYQATALPLVGILLQSLYGLFMLFLPTSVVLVAGLSYFEISYKEWFKYIWKYLLQVLVTIILIVIVLALLV